MEADANKPTGAMLREERIKHCVEKADLLQKLMQKQCYSRSLLTKKYVNNIRKLNDFYGLDYRQDWGESGAEDDDESVLTVETTELANVINRSTNITYRNLVERVDHAQENYEVVRDRKGLRAKLEKSVQDKSKSADGLNIFEESQM